MRFISVIALFASTVIAKDNFFKDVIRPQIFEISDNVIPKITISLSQKDLKSFFQNYQCEYDTSRLVLKRNEECYSPTYINLSETLNSIVTRLKVNINDANDALFLKKPSLSIAEFEYIVTKYCGLTLERALHPDYAGFRFYNYNFYGSLTFDVNGQKTSVSNVKVSPGDVALSKLSKLSYNIKMKSGQLFGKDIIQLRAENGDPSLLREKLVYDICNVAELATLSANFVKLYFNDRYMGLYTMRDTIDSIWADENFGEKDSSHIYKCSNKKNNNDPFYCENNVGANDTNFINFLNRLKNVQSKEELEKFFNVNMYMRWLALRYLLGSNQHFTKSNDSYLYRFKNMYNNNEIWIPTYFNFEFDLGSSTSSTIFPNPKHSIKDIITEDHPIINLLKIRENESVLLPYIQEIMTTVFNPKILIPHIDQLKQLIDSEVREDRTPDSNNEGRLPGRLPRAESRIEDTYTYEDFKNNSEYTSYKVQKYLNDEKVESEYVVYGLKQWIIERFQYTCKTYALDCSFAQEYLNTPVDSNPRVILREEKKGGCENTGYECCPAGTRTETQDAAGKWARIGKIWCLISNKGPVTATTTASVVPRTSTTTTIANRPKTTTTTITTIKPRTTITTTIAVTTTTATTTTQSPTPGQCADAYMPCGGSRFPNAPKCCVEDYYCETSDPTYHQCYPDLSVYENPGKSSDNKSTTTTTKSAEPTPNSGECAKLYQPCGGSTQPDAPHCCEEGAKCVKFNENYHQCMSNDFRYDGISLKDIQSFEDFQSRSIKNN